MDPGFAGLSNPDCTAHNKQIGLNKTGHSPQWDVQQLRPLWKPEIANKIIQIPSGDDDVSCWGQEQARTCTVKAIYYSIQTLCMGSHPQLRKVWALDIPSNFIFFQWRMLLGCLSTRIVRFITTIDPMCVCCHCEPKSNDHLFTKCFLAQQTWNELPPHVGKQTSYDIFAQWLSKQMTVCGSLGDVVSWYLWKAQNAYVFLAQTCLPQSAIFFKALSLIHQYNILKILKVKPHTNGLPTEHWIPIEGLELANNLNINDIIIEGDSMVIIDKLQKSRNMSWNLIHLWRKTKLQLEKLTSWQIHFSHRTTNTD